MKELTFASVSRLASLLRDRSVSAVEVTEIHLARIDEVNPSLNAVVTRCDELALAQARKADAARARGTLLGPLHGVPVTIKDAFDTAGVRSTGGTTGRAAHVPSSTATAVERLLRAGAILIGKTNTSELTLFYDTDNLVFGKTRNPYDLRCSPGGSSGGAAAIVAAGGSPLDLGSDTGGSIRLPAHYCGVAGLKPTAGRVPNTGLIVPGDVPVAPLTQVGPIARFVEDLALVLPILAGVDARDPRVAASERADRETAAMETLRVAFYTDNGEVAASPEVAAAVRECARVLAGQGATVTEERPPGIEHTRPLFRRFFETDGGAWIRRILQTLGTTQVSPYLEWAAAGDGVAEPAASAMASLGSAWDRYRRDMLGFMRQHDVIVAPVHAGAALPHGELTGADNSPGFGFSQAWNLTGWPSVVVRAGTSRGGLPIGVQVVAGPWEEGLALEVARRIEQALGGWQPPGPGNRAGARTHEAAVEAV